MGYRAVGLGIVISIVTSVAAHAAEPIGVADAPRFPDEPAPALAAPVPAAPASAEPSATPPTPAPAQSAPAVAPAAPAPIIVPPSSPDDAPPPPDEPIERHFAFKANYGIGFFWPSDVNAYLKSRVPQDSGSLVRDLSTMYLLFSADVSVAYFPTEVFGIRPNLLYLFSYKANPAQGGGTDFFWLHSLAPGLSLDFVLETHKLARFFASPGVSYQFAWLGDYSAHGLGLELALGTELSFGRHRNKGASIALVLRRASLGIDSRPREPLGTPTIDNLDFSSIMVRLGFQYGS